RQLSGAGEGGCSAPLPCYTAIPSAAPRAQCPRAANGISVRSVNRSASTMKLTIERAALLKALGHVQSVVDRRTTIPILSNVLLRAEVARRLSVGELPHQFTLSAAELRRLIDRTRFAISTEETRYYLNGIYLHATKSNEVPVVRAVATDGHRLARVEMSAPEGAAGMPGIIVPRKTVLELRKLVEEGEDEVQVALGETKIRCAIGEAALTSKLIDGTFPDYDRVIPVNNDKILDVECKEFADAVDRVSTISTERS